MGKWAWLAKSCLALIPSSLEMPIPGHWLYFFFPLMITSKKLGSWQGEALAIGTFEGKEGAEGKDQHPAIVPVGGTRRE